MKKLLFKSVLTLFSITAFSQTILTKEERSKASDHLRKTETELVQTIKGLSEQQLNFKSDQDSWSIAECLEHLAISEQNLTGMLQESLKQDTNPSNRKNLAMNDEQLLTLISSRDKKVKTRKEFEPTNSFEGFNDALQSFRERRKNTIMYVKSTNDDLRNHFLEFPFGLIDSYQTILFMSSHTKRHTDQIIEIKENASFPN